MLSNSRPVFTFTMFCLIILLTSSIPVPYRSMCFVLELQNIAACHVFRDLKLGYMYDDPADVPTQKTSTVRFAIPLSSQSDESIEMRLSYWSLDTKILGRASYAERVNKALKSRKRECNLGVLLKVSIKIFRVCYTY